MANDQQQQQQQEEAYTHGGSDADKAAVYTAYGGYQNYRAMWFAAMAQQAAQGQDGQQGHTDYSTWSNAQLVARVTELEARLKASNERFSAGSPERACSAKAPNSNPAPRPTFKKQRKPPAPFDPSKYSTRLIALKFAYLGARYNGYEHHANNSTPLPTVEEELFRALRKTRLIFPRDGEGRYVPEYREGNGEEVNWEGCEYSKCGRTDRGVSAFGQVVGVRVRSNRPLPGQRTRKRKTTGSIESGAEGLANGDAATAAAAEQDLDEPRQQGAEEEVEEPEEPPFGPIRDELPYPALLNRVLPPDIRVLAWCPNPPANFSARFSCKERRYRYFFTNPAFLPVGGAPHGNSQQVLEGWLDIERMREAAKLLEGLHDFRNLCKVDPAKQIANFERRIFHADIEEIDTPPPSFLAGGPLDGLLSPESPSSSHNSPAPTAPPKLHAFTLHGSAFLWHQVRHIVALLFLIGQGLEPVSLISDLLDTATNPRKPKYEMAAATPLVLWDCIFPAPLPGEGRGDEDGGEGEGRSVKSRPDALEWVHVGTGGVEAGRSKAEGKGGLMEELWEVWRGRKMDEVLAASLLDVAAAQGRRQDEERVAEGREAGSAGRSTRVFDGGDTARLAGKYVPVMQKGRMDSVEVINARYAAKKGLDQRALQVRQAVEDDGDE